MATLTPERMLLMIFGAAFAVGAADYFCGGKLGLGKKFSEGLQTFAPLFLTMAGFLVLTPLIAKLIAPAAAALCSSTGTDPGLFSGIILANDNGAYPLAQSLARSPEAPGFCGMLLGSIVGANIVCMPLIFQLLAKEDHDYYFKGLMFGIITMPLALLVGGICAKYSWSFMLRQLPPLAVLAAAAGVLLYLIPQILTGILRYFAKTMELIALTGISAAVFMDLAGHPVKSLMPVNEAVKIIGAIAVMLGGVYVFTTILSIMLKKFLPAVSGKLGVNDVAVTGIITTLANAIPTMAMIKDMDNRGKMLNCAFLSSGAFMLGDHLAYCSAAAPELIFPLLATKLTGAVSAAILAYIYCRKNSL